MKSWQVLRFASGLLFLAGSCLAQRTTDNLIHDVNVCELLKSPTSYDAKLVRFRGRLNHEFEGADVDDKACQTPFSHTAIWWAYGGQTISTSSGKLDPVEKTTTPIVRDAVFAEFEAKTHAHRTKRPDGAPCYSYDTCAFYDVVATFTRKFFAYDVKNAGRTNSGYGHLR